MITGALAITVACPTDMAKVRLQGQGFLPVSQRAYKSSIDCYKKTFQSQGIRGLWTGWTPNVCRNSIMNACELASYDQFKQMAMSYGCEDCFQTHFLCCVLTSLVLVGVGSPVDIIKTRVMNRKPGSQESLPAMIQNMLVKEGPLSFYKGWSANFARQLSWVTVAFITLEQIRALVPNASD